MSEKEPSQEIIDQINDEDYGKQPDIVSNAEISPIIIGDLKISALESYGQNADSNESISDIKADDLILSDENAMPLPLSINGKECYFTFSANTDPKYIMKVINFFGHVGDKEVTMNVIGKQKSSIEQMANKKNYKILKDSQDLKEYLEQLRRKEG